MRVAQIVRYSTVLLSITALAFLAAPASAKGGKKPSVAPMAYAAALPPCNGTFSDGKTKINVAHPAYMPDVPLTINKQTDCDVHTFAWNQFLYYTQMLLQGAKAHTAGTIPRFMALAPWYNALTVGPKPGQYPGGPVDLRTAFVDKSQAGTDGHLIDVAGSAVRYDIRFDVNMYNSIVFQNLYSEPLFNTACDPDPANQGVCKNNLKLWMSPSGANEHPEPGSIEVKTAWRDFGAPGKCPASEYYCNGRFGLVGLHYVNKTFSHGEWIWASFEHVANDPDCAPGGDEPIAAKSLIGAPWAFFNPTTAGPGVLNSKMCNITNAPPQCNADPNPSGDHKTFVQVNVCRTDAIAGGGASAANCAVSASGNNAGNVACLNATIMPKRSGVWRHYKMIGAVWTSGGMGPNQDFRVQIFQQQVQGIPYAAPAGFTHLSNTTMETWLQNGSTGFDPFKLNATQAGCFLCHNMPSSFGEQGKQVDLSHFPGKLPLLKLEALRNSLIKATDTAKAPN